MGNDSSLKNSTEVELPKGLLYASLARTNKQIIQQRGEVIAEDLEMVYSRKIEDILRNIKRLKREQENMFDFSPENAQSLMLRKDVNPDEILEQDINLLVKIREEEIKIDILRNRFEELFGRKI